MGQIIFCISPFLQFTQIDVKYLFENIIYKLRSQIMESFESSFSKLLVYTQIQFYKILPVYIINHLNAKKRVFGTYVLISWFQIYRKFAYIFCKITQKKIILKFQTLRGSIQAMTQFVTQFKLVSRNSMAYNRKQNFNFRGNCFISVVLGLRTQSSFVNNISLKKV